MFQTKFVEKIKTHILCSIFFFEIRALYVIMWKNIVQRDRPHVTMWRMRIACWTPKATNTHSGCVILLVFPLQQWLRERASVLTLYVNCLSCFAQSYCTNLKCQRERITCFAPRIFSKNVCGLQMPIGPIFIYLQLHDVARCNFVCRIARQIYLAGVLLRCNLVQVPASSWIVKSAPSITGSRKASGVYCDE